MSELGPHGTRTNRAVGLAMSTPMLVLIGAGFLIPLAWIARISFDHGADGGVLVPGFTFDAYVEFLSDSFYLEMVLRSIWISLLITSLAVILTYPIALFLHRSQSRWRSLLVILTVAPLLVSAVVRTYGWIVILGEHGWVNWVVTALGFEPIRLLNNYTGIVIGMVEIQMPYVALGLIAGFGRIDPTVEEAAATLGASPWRRFVRVTFPLSLPGVGLGFLLSYVLTISAFVTPTLLGGGRVFLIATEIYAQALAILNWPLAAAMSVLMMLAFLLIIVGYALVRRRKAVAV